MENDQKVSAHDFKELEQFISKIIKEKQPFQRVVLTKEEALEMFKVSHPIPISISITITFIRTVQQIQARDYQR